MRPEIKATLYLPQKASNEYIYGSTRAEACGMRLLAEDADIAAVDSDFKLLASPDIRVKSNTRISQKRCTRPRSQYDG